MLRALLEKLSHTGFGDEIGYDLFKMGLGKIFGRSSKKEGGDSSSSTPAQMVIDPRDDPNDPDGIPAYWAKVPENRRENLDWALEQLTQEQRDAAEKALREMLGGLKTGIFPKTLRKVITNVPHEVKDKSGNTHTVFKTKTIKEWREKPGWDPGRIWVQALNSAGKTKESAERFWAMMLQESWFQRLLRGFSEWASENEESFRYLCMAVGAVAILLALLLGFAILAIPALGYQLAIGPAASASGVGGVLWSVLLLLVPLFVLSIAGFILLRLMGFSPSRQKYWAVIAFLTTVGLGTRMLGMFIDLSEHPRLATLAVMAIAILVWNGVYRRLQGEGAVVSLNRLATALLVVAILGMLAGPFARRIPSRLLGYDGTSHLTGLVGWCRPDTRGIAGWDWPEGPPSNVPRKFRCSETTEEGLDPVTLLPAIQISAGDAAMLFEWEARESESESEEVLLTDLDWEFCWQKNDGTTGVVPDLREDCNPAKIVRLDSMKFEIVVYYRHEGRTYQANMEWSFSREKGTWDQPAPQDSGEWEMDRVGAKLFSGSSSNQNGNYKSIQLRPPVTTN